ncbi:MAG: flagellar hook protein FlgE [Pseudomonadota bacterium]|nr:flagellar hook protein FlgE [Pseudomonadota bacterium]
MANNIANNNTTGFKASRAEFADIFTSTSGRTSIGSGVQLAAVTQEFTQGNITTTGNALDLAINGQGFFQLDDNGQAFYSRAGFFQVNRDGFIVNNLNQRLIGFQLDNNGFLSQTLGEIRLPTAEGLPRATSRTSFGANLNAITEPPALAFDPLNPNTFNHSTALTVYDSLGVGHNLTAYFIKNPALNRWDLRLTLDGTSPDHVTLSNGALQFTDEGLFDLDATPQPITATVDLNAVASELAGAPVTGPAQSPLAFEVDLSELTQFGSPFSTNALGQDGFTSGRLLGVEVADDGIVFGRFSNGQTQTMGQVALVNFRNPQGLRPVGDTQWVQTSDSGVPVSGAPGSASLGLIRSGALEDSNVDLTEELVNMIQAQRNFQANARAISVSSELTGELINSIR